MTIECPQEVLPLSERVGGAGAEGGVRAPSDDESNEHIELHMARDTHSDNFILILTLGDINKEDSGSGVFV